MNNLIYTIYAKKSSVLLCTHRLTQMNGNIRQRMRKKISSTKVKVGRNRYRWVHKTTDCKRQKYCDD